VPPRCTEGTQPPPGGHYGAGDAECFLSSAKVERFIPRWAAAPFGPHHHTRFREDNVDVLRSRRTGDRRLGRRPRQRAAAFRSPRGSEATCPGRG